MTEDSKCCCSTGKIAKKNMRLKLKYKLDVNSEAVVTVVASPEAAVFAFIKGSFALKLNHLFILVSHQFLHGLIMPNKEMVFTISNVDFFFLSQTNWPIMWNWYQPKNFCAFALKKVIVSLPVSCLTLSIRVYLNQIIPETEQKKNSWCKRWRRKIRAKKRNSTTEIKAPNRNRICNNKMKRRKNG